MPILTPFLIAQWRYYIAITFNYLIPLITLQILRVSPNPNGLNYLYVTDYTAHPGFPPMQNDAWARGLEGRILKIGLWDEQIDLAKFLEPGHFYSISKLRLKKFSVGNGFLGRLGGPERLIKKLLVPNDSNENLSALIK
jgi:hypothetical protein